MAATASRPGRTLALLKDELGATISEFAVVAPVFLLMMMGTFDAAHTMYVRAVMQGAVYKAARETALKAGQKELQQISIDNELKDQIRLLVPKGATINDPVRASYKNFADAAKSEGEPVNDTVTANGICDPGERFEDRNGNGQYDAANTGQGGARDIVRYSITVSYNSFFPMPAGLGERELTATSVIANQPFSDQKSRPELDCPDD
jgi:hypothetical protein